MLRRFVGIVLVSLAMVIVTGSPAWAAGCSGLRYSADLRVVVGPPAVGIVIGNARVDGIGHRDQWNAAVRVSGIPTGRYDYAVIIGTDVNGDGIADSFDLRSLCSFESKAGATTGCSVAKASLGRTDLGSFASVNVIQTGNPTFLKAVGSLTSSH